MGTPLLCSPGLTAYLGGRFLLSLIARAQGLAIGFHVYEITDDPIAIGYVGLAMFLPVVGFGLFAGDVADRVNRALMLAVGSLFVGASSCGLFVLAAHGTDVVWPYYVLTALFGSALACGKPALPSLVTELVPASSLTRAIAMSSGASQMASIIGPAAVGILLIAGPAPAYAVMAAAAAVAAILWFRLVPLAAGEKAPQNGLSTIGRISAGIRIVVQSPLILGAVSLDLFAVLLGGVMALLPVVARDILLVGPASLGLLRAAPAIGAAIAAVVLARVGFSRHAGPIMLAGVAAFGVCILVFGLSRSLPLSLAALCVSGAVDMMSNVVRGTTIQLSAPNAIRGRVNAVEQIFVSGSNELGDFRAGVMAGLIGTVPAILIGGLGTIGVAALWASLFPSLRRLDRMSELDDRQTTPAIAS